MTNVSTFKSVTSHTSTVESAEAPTFPNTYNIAPGPTLTQIRLNGSLSTAFGAITYVNICP